MKKVLVMVALVMVSVIVYAFNDSGESNQGKKEVTGNGEVVVMDKDMFLKDVFDYEKSKENMQGKLSSTKLTWKNKKNWQLCLMLQVFHCLCSFR